MLLYCIAAAKTLRGIIVIIIVNTVTVVKVHLPLILSDDSAAFPNSGYRSLLDSQVFSEITNKIFRFQQKDP